MTTIERRTAPRDKAGAGLATLVVAAAGAIASLAGCDRAAVTSALGGAGGNPMMCVCPNGGAGGNGGGSAGAAGSGAAGAGGARAAGGDDGTAGTSAGGTTGGTAGAAGAGGATGGTAGGTAGAGAGGGTMVTCIATTPGAPLGEASHPEEGFNHVTTCSAVTYGTIPPSSGNHYGIWPDYKTYAAPVPWGFMVHGLEHGAVEVVYNCPCGCADEVAAAQAWIDALPIDTDCDMPPRVILAPDPTLDVRWAATAWTWTLRAQSFDRAAFQSFFDAHYNHGREEICGGAADGSVTGWCP